MYKIVVIDDEEWIRQGLIKKIIKSGLNFDEVAEARNADEGLKIIKKIKPDIVICDIRMHEMDGLELSKIVSKTFPDTKIVIISGFDEFDYIKKALQLGAIDYLVKPVNNLVLYETLKKCIGMIEKKSNEQKKLKTMATLEQLNESRNRFLKYLANKEINLKDIFVDYKEDSSLFKCVYLYVNNQIDLEKDIVIGDIYNESVVWEYSRNIIIYKNNINEYVLIFCITDSKNKDSCDNLITDVVNRIENKIQSLKIFQYTFGVSDYNNNPEESIIEAVNAMKNRVLEEENNVIYYKNIKENKEKYKLQTQTEILIKNNIQTYQYKNLLNILKEIFNEIKILKISYINIQNLYTNLLLIGINVFNTDIESKLCFYPKEAYSFDCLQDLFDFIKEQYLSIINTTFTEELDYKKKLIYEVKEYIDLNYDKKITLESIASIKHVNFCYLSMLYKEVLNINFQNYLMSVRIDNAKILLKKKIYKIKQIANMTGFTEEHYFSKVFKKMEGVPPKEYITNQDGEAI